MEGLSTKYESLVAEGENLHFPQVLYIFNSVAKSKTLLIICLDELRDFVNEISTADLVQ
jgi:hypothetical protein